MPKKPKLLRNQVPPKKLVKPHELQQCNTANVQSSTEPLQTVSGLSPEAEDQFELELFWCIQQLQAGLTDLKLEDKQIYNMTKSLNVLKNNNSPLIKKRQVMRNTFGDYRSKMLEDEKKFGKSTTVVKFVESNKKLEKKSIFLKKAPSLNRSHRQDKPENSDTQVIRKAIMNPDISSEPFKFNFSINEP